MVDDELIPLIRDTVFKRVLVDTEKAKESKAKVDRFYREKGKSKDKVKKANSAS